MTFLSHVGQLFVLGPLRELRRRGPGQIAALDFLRACAVLLVLGFHFGDAYREAGGSENALSTSALVRNGWMGVDLFFVLSGFLIGKQLWRELDRTGSVDVKHFILRRGLRIWPLYYAFFLFVAFALGRGGYDPGAWWADLVFLSNYSSATVVSGGWSLSVEEQFYLLAPLLLLFTAPRLNSPRAYRGWLIGLFFLFPLIRFLTGWWLTGDLTSAIDGDAQERYLYLPFHTRADGLVMGLFLAHLEVFDGDRYKQGLAGSIWPVVAALALFLARRADWRGSLNYTAHALVFGSVAWFLMARRRRWLAFLDSRVFYVLSRLSFGMYLNHFYLQHLAARFGLDYMPLADSAPLVHHAASFLVFVAVSAGVATLTFALIESPFLRLREWLYSSHAARRPAPIPIAGDATVQPATTIS